jgi:hypothetical protein
MSKRSNVMHMTNSTRDFSKSAPIAAASSLPKISRATQGGISPELAGLLVDHARITEEKDAIGKRFDLLWNRPDNPENPKNLQFFSQLGDNILKQVQRSWPHKAEMDMLDKDHEAALERQFEIQEKINSFKPNSLADVSAMAGSLIADIGDDDDNNYTDYLVRFLRGLVG